MQRQTLLTESVAKFESKLTDTHFSQSFHHVIGASNNNAQELLKMNKGNRRYVIINTALCHHGMGDGIAPVAFMHLEQLLSVVVAGTNTIKLPYSTEGWAKLWHLVKHSAVRELFWQFLRARGVSKVQPGRAPSNQTKAAAVAEQAPDAVQYLKHLSLVALNGMHPRDTLSLVGSNSFQLLLAVHERPKCFALREWPSGISAGSAFHKLLSIQLEGALLQKDFVQTKGICTNVLEKLVISAMAVPALRYFERGGVQA